ncbi:MAG: ABC transporter permease [Rhodospirillales bacterium]
MSVAGIQRLRRSRLGGLPITLLLGIAVTGAWVILALAADLVAPYSPIAQDVPSALQPPSFAHPLGTDNYGRDILSRIIHGARVDLQIGLFGVLFPFLIGNVIGLIAGYFGGLVDTLLMRLLEVTIAFPFFVLVIAIISILGPGLTSLYIALALVGWVSYARLTRAQILILKKSDFVGAARVLGYGNRRIMLRHLLPNAISPSVVFAMTDMILVILLGASLSYLGLGAQPPAAEWGVMIAEGQQFLATAWWICLFPGLAIVLLGLGLSLSADGMAQLLGTKE